MDPFDRQKRIIMWLKSIIIISIAIATCIVVATIYGALHWKAGTKELRVRLETARLTVKPLTFDPQEIKGLPQSVQRYFRSVLKDGQPLITSARISHEGLFNLSKTSEKWSNFSSNQIVITQRPGFDWDGRITVIPGVNVHVHDAYVSGEGILHAALLGLLTLANTRSTPEAAQGELMRFLAEAAWYPTSLLPSQGVHWEAIDSSSARATLRDGDVTVSLDFHFNREGLIMSISADARVRLVNGSVNYAPWQGRFWEYELRDGMYIPLQGEVAWQLPEGSRSYWRGRITSIVYEFAR